MIYQNVVTQNITDISDVSGLVFDLSNVVTQNIIDISDVSGLVFDLSNVVTKNITDISDVSGLVFDLSNVVTQNITDISDVCRLVFDLSNVVTQNITDISDVSGLVFDLSNVVTQNITDISDVSGLVFDLSNVVTQNITDISDVSGLVFDLSSNFYTLSGDYDAFKQNVKTNDLSVNNITSNTGNNIRFLSDVSFNQDVTITGDLIIDGSFNFNEVIQNITTINNEILVSTQLDICNQGTGPALEVTQIGNHDIALFKSSVTEKAFEITSDGKSIFYKDVSFNGKVIVDDLSNQKIYDLSNVVTRNITDISDVSS